MSKKITYFDKKQEHHCWVFLNLGITKTQDMISFNTEMVKTWKGCGYKYIHILPFEKYGVLQPLVHDKDVKKGYTIFIEEMGLIQMAEDYFLTKEKFAFEQSLKVWA